MATAVAQHDGAGLSLCLASLGVVKALSVAAFTLAWTHSIEKVEWQEDWRITASGLELMEARVKGSGAGMEPPPQARLIDGWFRWKPERPAMPEVILGNSGVAGEWRLCAGGKCRTLSEIFGRAVGANPTILSRCGVQSRGKRSSEGQKVLCTAGVTRKKSREKLRFANHLST
jgi:hypothetical protein